MPKAHELHGGRLHWRKVIDPTDRGRAPR
jgi:hypothetical protein